MIIIIKLLDIQAITQQLILKKTKIFFLGQKKSFFMVKKDMKKILKKTRNTNNFFLMEHR